MGRNEMRTRQRTCRHHVVARVATLREEPQRSASRGRGSYRDRTSTEDQQVGITRRWKLPQSDDIGFKFPCCPPSSVPPSSSVAPLHLHCPPSVKCLSLWNCHLIYRVAITPPPSGSFVGRHLKSSPCSRSRVGLRAVHPFQVRVPLSPSSPVILHRPHRSSISHHVIAT